MLNMWCNNLITLTRDDSWGLQCFLNLTYVSFHAIFGCDIYIEGYLILVQGPMTSYQAHQMQNRTGMPVPYSGSVKITTQISRQG